MPCKSVPCHAKLNKFAQFSICTPATFKAWRGRDIIRSNVASLETILASKRIVSRQSFRFASAKAYPHMTAAPREAAVRTIESFLITERPGMSMISCVDSSLHVVSATSIYRQNYLILGLQRTNSAKQKGPKFEESFFSNRRTETLKRQLPFAPLLAIDRISQDLNSRRAPHYSFVATL